MSTTLPLYWNLSSASKEERLDASVKLVSSLQQFQLQLQRDEDENLTFEESNSEDVKYALKRLVRGLASPRESSRLGFAVALTEVDRVLCLLKGND
jgi:DNA polymerase phi